MSLPCNCYHSEADHYILHDEENFYTWCRYSEIGQCPCDAYTPMDNLQYLEWEASLAEIDKLIKQKGI